MCARNFGLTTFHPPIIFKGNISKIIKRQLSHFELNYHPTTMTNADNQPNASQSHTIYHVGDPSQDGPGARIVHIQMDMLPKQAFFGPLFGYTQSDLARLLLRGHITTSRILGRDVSSEEMARIAYWVCRGYRVFSNVEGLCAFPGLLFWALRTSNDWKYVSGTDTKDLIKKQVLSGTTRRIFNTVARGVAYCGPGLLLSRWLARKIGHMVSVTGFQNDPLLERLRNDMAWAMLTVKEKEHFQKMYIPMKSSATGSRLFKQLADSSPEDLGSK